MQGIPISARIGMKKQTASQLTWIELSTLEAKLVYSLLSTLPYCPLRSPKHASISVSLNELDDTSIAFLNTASATIQ